MNRSVPCYCFVKMVGTVFKGWIGPFLDHSHSVVESCQKTNLDFTEIRHQTLELHCRRDETVFWSKVKEKKRKINCGEMSAMQTEPSG